MSYYKIREAYKKLLKESFAGPIPSTGAVTTGDAIGDPSDVGYGPEWGGIAQGGSKLFKRKPDTPKKKKKKKKKKKTSKKKKS
jgi:hypothetical protein